MVKILKTYSPAVVIFALFLIIPLTIGNTTDVQNMIIYILIYAMVGEAWNLISGFCGQTSFGHAAYFGLGAYTTGVMFQYYQITPWLSMLAGGLISVILAFVCYYNMFKLKGHYFAIGTLCIPEILKVLFGKWEYVGKGDGIALSNLSALIPDSSKNAWGKLAYLSLDVRNRIPFLVATLVMCIIIFVVCAALENSKIGFYWKTIRESHEVAESIGINPRNYKLLAMCISAFIASIGGSFYMMFFKYVDVDSVFSLSISMIFVLVTVLGGLGNVYGPIIGSVIYYALELLMRRTTGGTTSGINLIIFGMLIVLVTCFEPKGIMGIIERILGKDIKSRAAGGDVKDGSAA